MHLVLSKTYLNLLIQPKSFERIWLVLTVFDSHYPSFIAG